MDKRVRQLLAAFLMGVIMPVMVMQLGKRIIFAGGTPADPEQTQQEQTQETEPALQAQLRIPVLLEESSLRFLETEEYVLAVVLAEMPVNFEFEALKAQAVAARTCALQCTREGTKHPGGAVCTDPKCCQSYLQPSDYLTAGGSQEAVDKLLRAVRETAGQVLTYDGELIQATYFSCSGGQTEDAVAVWGTEVPYLVSVSSPGEEAAPVFTSTVTFSDVEFAAHLGRDLKGSCESWLGSVSYTRGGSVATMVIAGKTYTGTQLRQLLDIPSAAFQMTAQGAHITVTTTGKGHRVGMSQYGADAMARTGSAYDAILAHYYPGTRIDKVDVLG